MTQREIQIHIERYIKGELTPYLIDELWIEFIKDSELYSYFLTELHLTALIYSQKKPIRECKK